MKSLTFKFDTIVNLETLFFGFLLLQMLLTSLQAHDLPDSLKYKQVPVQQGDICIVCDVKLDEKGFAFIYHGQRVSIDYDHLVEFLENPVKYLKKGNSRNKVARENIFQKPALEFGWVMFIVWIFIGGISAAVCSRLALRKGLPRKKWIVIGLVVNIIGVLFILTKFKQNDRDVCHICKMPKKPSEIICSVCENSNKAEPELGLSMKLEFQDEKY